MPGIVVGHIVLPVVTVELEYPGVEPTSYLIFFVVGNPPFQVQIFLINARRCSRSFWRCVVFFIVYRIACIWSLKVNCATVRSSNRSRRARNAVAPYSREDIRSEMERYWVVVAYQC